MRPAPKRILITGASSGLGAALARGYAAPSIDLLLIGRDGVRLRAVALDCTARGANVHYICADVRDQDVMYHWILDQDRQAPIDLVIANAGVSGGTLALTSSNSSSTLIESAGQIKQIYDINVQGVMNTVVPILPRMIERGGQIAMMSSLAAFAPWPGAPTYAASKAAVKTYGLALRTALAESGVRVSVICPGFIETPMTNKNPYRMPWLMDVHQAAAVIMVGLRYDRALIAFPWQAALLARLIGILPYGVQRLILARAPAKPAIPDLS